MKRTRQAHSTDATTVFALSERKSGKTLRALANELGQPYFSIATLSDVLRGRPGALTEVSENDLRQRLGLPVIVTAAVPVCPIHGEPHVADCHGQPVAAVVALAPGQHVARDRKPAPVRTLSDYPVAVLAWKLAQREPMEAA